MFSVADGSSHTYQVPELSNYRCLETPRGLVLNVDTSSLQSFLWNPQTGEKLALPAMDKPLPERCQCLLSDTISSPDCLVLVSDLKQPQLLFCKVRGGSAWVSQSYDLGCYDLPESYSAPKKQLIGARLVVVCLFMLGPNFERIEDVGAYRMDFSKQEWCKVTETDIGDRAFLLGPANFAASCSAMEPGLKRGCVYYSYEILGVFDLLDDTCRIAGPTQDIPVLTRVPFWMVPVLK
ncbi:hypothetical protein QOZ80_1BG0059420 [Eleusine coracana subsp. coracana]|nr:hypothetical protein QOZ80_1BG0059420 [Eleusine coracana subsp. coracana]